MREKTPENGKLTKNLKLFDVYAISTGAMFSSGFFLLPGIAAAQTGPSASMAYLLAGVMILPAMFCMAELSTAMPKAGGTYFFLDRTLGPMMGTIGGLGSWVAVVFKSAFALVGMGAYLALYVDVPITVLAVVLAIVFGIINVFGAKETTLLQRFLVTTLVVILAGFVIQGLAVVGVAQALAPRSDGVEFLSSGVIGFIATIGLVFVSYAGLTKVASVAEEVENPDRNIPLGMTLSLITATLIYTLGMSVIATVLPPDELHVSLTPVADAGRYTLGWMPYDLGVILIVVAAIAAFASTGNAGIMSASRYPFAMAKDELVPESLSRIGRFGTPTRAIVITVFAMVAILLVLDVASVAKLASAFQLLLFGLISLCVIVMRESGIESYKPGFRSPFYPWMQIAGILISFWLIVEMGLLAIGFTGMLAIACGIWYQLYGSPRTRRAGAIFHLHARLGENRYEGLERELMAIIHERTSDENLSYESLVSRCEFVDSTGNTLDFERLSVDVAGRFHERTGLPQERLETVFGKLASQGQPAGPDVLIWYRSIETIEQPEMLVYCFPRAVDLDVAESASLHTLIFLLAPRAVVGLDLRLAGHLAEIVQSGQFERDWLSSVSHRDRREILMRDDHFLHTTIERIPFLARRAGKKIGDIELPGSCLIALVERGDQILTAKSHLQLLAGDEVAVIGEPEDLELLQTSPA